MERILNLTKISRQNYGKFLTLFNEEQLNYIPQGFSNNMVWNIGHIVSVFDSLTYSLSGLATRLPLDFHDQFRKGTKPEMVFSKKTIDFIAQQLEQQVVVFENDFKSNLFQNYKEYTTSFNNTLQNIMDATTFNLVHEGIHLGYLLNIKRMLTNG